MHIRALVQGNKYIEYLEYTFVLQINEAYEQWYHIDILYLIYKQRRCLVSDIQACGT